MHYIKLKNKIHVMISIGTEETFNKIQHFSVINILSMLSTEGNSLTQSWEHMTNLNYHIEWEKDPKQYKAYHYYSIEFCII